MHMQLLMRMLMKVRNVMRMHVHNTRIESGTYRSPDRARRLTST
jgi:hypothetical protein